MPLTGHRILLVDDDRDAARGLTRALKSVSAKVVGPCLDEDSARQQLRLSVPTGAILDIHLGEGTSFRLAETLARGGIPFLFINGDDRAVIPDEFTDVARLQKPVSLDDIVAAISAL